MKSARGLNPVFTRRAILKLFRLPSFCVAISIFGMIPLLTDNSREAWRKDQYLHRSLRPRRFPLQMHADKTPRVLSIRPHPMASRTALLPDSHINGAMNAGLCGLSDRPAWCRGSEIGAWTNSAIAVLGAARSTSLPELTRKTTSIVKPRCVKLHGASADSTFLSWTPTHGVAIIMGDGMGATGFAGEGALEDLTLIAPVQVPRLAAFILADQTAPDALRRPQSILQRISTITTISIELERRSYLPRALSGWACNGAIMPGQLPSLRAPSLSMEQEFMCPAPDPRQAKTSPFSAV